MTNEKVRKALKEFSVTQWRLAELIGVSEPTLTRKFRHELPEEEQEKMITLIKTEKAKEK